MTSPAPLTWQYLRGGSEGGEGTCQDKHSRRLLSPRDIGWGSPTLAPGLEGGEGCSLAQTTRGANEVVGRRAKEK